MVDELLRRGIVRTWNSPLGDLDGWIAFRASGGGLASNSEKGYDLSWNDGERVQVKGRLVDRADRRLQPFSAFRSWAFDIAVFVLSCVRTYDIIWARERIHFEPEQFARRVEHANPRQCSSDASRPRAGTCRMLALDSPDEPG
ncbi:hypothetical protein [Curtobacterium sp. BH-2-1-1]|uniref:hypothetical protein n=1 Tax=Curtobacterium sp. BH-2-1-1 TaxID=1905847 RepID=UPI0012EAD78D|nr:hypothetical protein [Curtobacterium sp. BH-2-1-1]